MTPRAAIGRLKLVAALVSDLRPFYAAYRESWVEAAREVARNVLVVLKPETIEAEEWVVKVEELVETVAAELIGDGAMAGVAIRMGMGAKVAGDITDPKFYRLGEMSIDDVERWVAAGRDGSAPEGVGKNLDERDAKKSDLQIAWRVMYAMKLNRPGAQGLARAIERFKAWESGLEIDGLLEEVLKVWMAVFELVAARDLRAWVAELIRE